MDVTVHLSPPVPHSFIRIADFGCSCSGCGKHNFSEDSDTLSDMLEIGIGAGTMHGVKMFLCKECAAVLGAALVANSENLR